MHFEGLSARLDGRSGAERVVGSRAVLDYDEWILISDKSWEATSHILLNIHC